MITHIYEHIKVVHIIGILLLWALFNRINHSMNCLCTSVASFLQFSTWLQTFRAFMGNLKLDEKRVQIGCRIQFNFQICTLKQQTSSSETNCSPAFRFHYYYSWNHTYTIKHNQKWDFMSDNRFISFVK